MAIPLLVAFLALLPSLAKAYSFNLMNTPEQCQNLTIGISGSGNPPYSATIIPYGATPLANNVEVRTILDRPFDGDSTSMSFQLTYPSNSQFVVVMSDSAGFASGGTSAIAQVQSGSSDSSCYNKTQVSPPFGFSIVPTNSLFQCEPSRIWWTESDVQGDVSFYLVIPAGQSGPITQGALTTVPAEGVGFNYSVPVRVGTNVIIVGGDNRGIGSGGSASTQIQPGVNGVNNNCLNSSSPSSTPGTPAGGSYPTNSQTSSSSGSKASSTSTTSPSNTSGAGGGGGSSSNAGAIAGGVVGGVAFLGSLAFAAFFLNRRQKHKHHKVSQNSVDLLHGDADDTPGGGVLPQFYQPEPFLVPEPTQSSHGHEYSDETGQQSMSADGRRQSTRTSSDYLRSGTPDAHTSRKSPLGPSTQFRPVNIVQHEDADGAEGAETIELPPAYNKIRRPESVTTASETAGPSAT